MVIHSSEFSTTKQIEPIEFFACVLAIVILFIHYIYPANFWPFFVNSTFVFLQIFAHTISAVKRNKLWNSLNVPAAFTTLIAGESSVILHIDQQPFVRK